MNGAFVLKRSQFYVVLATLGFSFILIFSTVLKNSGMSSFEQLFFRLSFGLLILSLVLLSKGRYRFIHGKDVRFFVTIGFVYALFTLSGLSSIVFGTPIAVAVALIYTQPIFTAIISHATEKEKVTAPRLTLIFVGVSGAFLVTGLPITNLQINVGIVFAILAGCFYAIYLWLKRQLSGKREYPPYQGLFNTFLFAIPPLLVTWLVFRNLSTTPLLVGMIIPETWQLLLLIGFATFSTILPYSLLNYVKPEEISPTSEGLLLLGDPLLHTLWAILLFEQYVTTIQYLGAALIVSSAAANLKLSSR